MFNPLSMPEPWLESIHQPFARRGQPSFFGPSCCPTLLRQLLPPDTLRTLRSPLRRHTGGWRPYHKRCRRSRAQAQFLGVKGTAKGNHSSFFGQGTGGVGREVDFSRPAFDRLSSMALWDLCLRKWFSAASVKGNLLNSCGGCLFSGHPLGTLLSFKAELNSSTSLSG